ncbi:hypothetical protein ACFSQ7_41395 [Paenibacillus rhizoplanae]
MLQVKDNRITLGQELEHLRNYLEIQKDALSAVV